MLYQKKEHYCLHGANILWFLKSRLKYSIRAKRYDCHFNVFTAIAVPTSSVLFIRSLIFPYSYNDSDTELFVSRLPPPKLLHIGRRTIVCLCFRRNSPHFASSHTSLLHMVSRQEGTLTRSALLSHLLFNFCARSLSSRVKWIAMALGQNRRKAETVHQRFGKFPLFLRVCLCPCWIYNVL